MAWEQPHGNIISGVGLVSGINTADLISKLIAIDARPLNTLKSRIQTQSQIKAAYQALTALFLLVKSAATQLHKPATFNVRVAKSSQPDVLTATPDTGTPVNNYSTQSGTGLLIREADKAQNKIDLYNDRVNHLQQSLDAEQTRLQKQFNAMESALSGLQSQQSALAALADLSLASTSNSR